MSGTIPLAPPSTGMISAATPFVAQDLTLAPLSFRFLFELWKDCGDYARRLTTLEAKMGVTDGSNASPGQIGEYMFGATSATITLANGAVTNLASIGLTAGDWDVIGNVSFFSPSGGTPFLCGVGVGSIDTTITAAFQAGPSSQELNTALSRHNVTAATTLWVVAQSNFTGTATQVTASIRARRVR